MLENIHQINRDNPNLARQRITRLTNSRKFGAQYYLALYFWQCPSMQMSYAWVSFFLALTIHVCQPMIALVQRGQWTDNTRVSSLMYIFVFILLTYYE
jgi:hypothetical protein